MKPTIDCDICLGKFYEDSIMYYMKNCSEHRITCNVCYKIMTHKTFMDNKTINILCPCCKNEIKEFIRLPCEEYDAVCEFPFTI